METFIITLYAGKNKPKSSKPLFILGSCSSSRKLFIGLSVLNHFFQKHENGIVNTLAVFGTGGLSPSPITDRFQYLSTKNNKKNYFKIQNYNYDSNNNGNCDTVLSLYEELQIRKNNIESNAIPYLLLIHEFHGILGQEIREKLKEIVTDGSRYNIATCIMSDHPDEEFISHCEYFTCRNINYSELKEAVKAEDCCDNKGQEVLFEFGQQDLALTWIQRMKEFLWGQK